jgi:hypothetical protein
MTQDARGQLYAGLEAVAQAALTDLGFPVTNVRQNYPSASTLQGLATAGPNPLVVVSLGRSVPAPQPIGLGGPITTPPTTTNQATAPQLVPVAALSTPVTFTVVGAGVTAKSIAGQMVSALAARVGAVSVVPLPDTMEQATNFTLTTPTTFGLTAQLSYASEQEDNSLDERRINRVDLMYTATHTRYKEQDVTLIQNVHLTVLSPSFR